MTIHDATEVAYKNCYAAGKRDAMKWIPVTERLPEDDRSVLVTCGRYYKSFIARYNHTWKKWRVSGTLHITHWMPLPLPPKEEK